MRKVTVGMGTWQEIQEQPLQVLMIAQHSVLIMVALVKELAMTKHYSLNRDTFRYDLLHVCDTLKRADFGHIS